MLASCQKEENNNATQPTMAVTYSTLDGTWMLDSWNMEPLTEGSFCYVTFDRTEQRFEMWDNIGSMYGRQTTGTFTIEQDEYKRYILRGSYDHGVGDWNMSYEVTMSYPGDEMTWRSTSTDDVATYCRVESMPEIVNN